jgi:hypothetical protein
MPVIDKIREIQNIQLLKDFLEFHPFLSVSMAPVFALWQTEAGIYVAPCTGTTVCEYTEATNI